MGTPTEILIERFDAKVTTSTGCWLWTGAMTKNGYGSFWDGTQARYAHRLAYEWLVGPIEVGLQLDHLCRVRHCVNPAHLEPVTQGDNVRRGVGPTAVHARKTHCIRGHELVGTNVRLRSTGRECRQCQRDRDTERRAAA